MTDEQAQEWWAIVERLPASWFPRETHALLAQYCRHVVAARRIAQLIAAAEAEKKINVIAYNRLLCAQTRESLALATLSVKMRISQSASVRAERAHKPDVVEARGSSAARPENDCRSAMRNAPLSSTSQT